jgi:hypothetical protein
MMLTHTGNNASSFLLKKRSQFLQTNADAHTKKRKSLSPDKKNLFDKNDAAALNKHCKSLTPNQKAQELEKMLSDKKIIASHSLLNKKLK